MKRLVLMLCAFFAAAVALAQDLYVYSIIGKAEVKNSGAWVQLQKRAKLQPEDVVKVGANSALSVLDRKNEKIYSIASSAEETVSSLIAKAKGSESSTAKFVAHASKSLFNGGSDRISHEAAGCTYRGDIVENDIAKALLYRQKDGALRKINNASTDYAVSFDVIGRETGKPVSANVKVGDQTFFRIKNASNKMLYVNVIDIDADGNLFDCLPVDDAQTLSHLLIPANATVDLSDYPMEFADPKGIDCMLLVASEVPYDLRLVNKMLKTKGIQPSKDVSVGVYKREFVVE